VKREGLDPRGIDDHYSKTARVGGLAVFFWMVIVIVYVLSPDVMDWFVVITFIDAIYWVALGMIICTLGGIIGAVGMATLGKNFRISFPEKETQLISHGIYSKTRNPIVLSIFLMMIGTFLIVPNLLTLFNLILNLVGYNAKASDEEVFLCQTFGQEWKDYVMRTGKYLPRIRNS
jgi:protein-S-isoprenylcysteine O-methyltransferase Ste14